ncbi:hypothetical protein H7X46_26640 [Pseudonocardia sp. C8]|uniref:hypothetical protein n=1 Tax=Pseudonocardia sp. C8 TaxID=2762759 RepID=UPI001643419A|nr:hypothetical protein [Pseudonocardia sp. C8]MBC3194632.1 hypothetical protein [Pseudonocardia sp. C8]
MSTSAHDPRGSASDSLITQINIDNVMQACRIFDEQVTSMQRAIQNSALLRNIPACGKDIVSADAQALFQSKIDRILAVHQDHLEEVREARDRLKKAALQYGFTEDQVETSLRAGTPGFRGPLAES